jgi:hypothetical protein
MYKYYSGVTKITLQIVNSPILGQRNRHWTLDKVNSGTPFA